MKKKFVLTSLLLWFSMPAYPSEDNSLEENIFIPIYSENDHNDDDFDPKIGAYKVQADANQGNRQLGPIGNDDRFSITQRTYPSSVVGRLKIREGTNTEGYCSAFLVGKKHVVTALHCLVDKKAKKFIPNIHFYPNDLNNYSFDKVRIANIRSGFDNYFTDNGTDRRHDWALLELNEEIGEKYGWIGMSIPKVSGFETKDHFSIGYSSDFKPHNPSNSGPCSILSDKNYAVIHTCDTHHGDSGSPIFYKPNHNQPLANAIIQGTNNAISHYSVSIARPMCNYNAIIAGTTTCNFNDSLGYESRNIPQCAFHKECGDSEYCNTNNECSNCNKCLSLDNSIDNNCPICEFTPNPTPAPTLSPSATTGNGPEWKQTAIYVGAGVVAVFVAGYCLKKVNKCIRNYNDRSSNSSHQDVNSARETPIAFPVPSAPAVDPASNV